METEYDYKEHLHRYAVWTAARAQRAFLTNNLINKVIENAGIKQEVASLNDQYNAEDFDRWHSDVTNKLLNELKKLKSDVAFGRAAKILNIYLKTTLVIPNCHKSGFLIDLIHPPIDRILLLSLIKKNHLPKNLFTSWTQMNESKYYEIIHKIRKVFPILWQSEVCWEWSENKEAE